MVRVSNAVVTTLNGMFLVVGLALIGVGIYSHVHAATTCQRALRNPLLVTGVITTVICLLGLVGSWYKNDAVLGLYLLCMVLLVAGLAGFTVFLFLVTKGSSGRAVVVREYRLGEYSHWLQNHFVKGKNWAVVRSCLVDAKVCETLSPSLLDQKNAANFLKNHFSPLQAGCCKPPAHCGFQYKNATYWTAPRSGPAADDTDCDTWSNKQNELCYNCNSCKAGSLANVRKQLRTMAIFFIFLIVFVAAVLAAACRNNIMPDLWNREDC